MSGYDAVLGTFPIWADGELTATSSLGSVSFNEANPENTKVYGDNGLDITNILIPNATNQINLTITASGQYYGWSCLNLYQTNIIELPIRWSYEWTWDKVQKRFKYGATDIIKSMIDLAKNPLDVSTWDELYGGLSEYYNHLDEVGSIDDRIPPSNGAF